MSQNLHGPFLLAGFSILEMGGDLEQSNLTAGFNKTEQVKSHRRFASNFQSYCQLVDNARPYRSNATGRPPVLIGWKDGSSELLVDPEAI